MIHNAIMEYVQTALQAALITNVDPDDTAKASIVKLGRLDGEPEPDIARISLELYENDPDQEIRGSGLSTASESWKDEIEETEVGGGITWRRRFTVKSRCLFANTQESLADSRKIASTVRQRIEQCIMKLSFTGVESDNEFVSMPAFNNALIGEMVQSGGPGSYDFHIKVKFEVWTTQVV